MKRILAVIVNYNGLSDSMECIESLLKSEMYNDILDIFFLDNHSEKDETIKVRRKYDGVVTYRSKVNGGFAYGNNIGIKYAIDNNYDYMLLINNDTVVDSEMIRLLVEYSDDASISTPKML